MPIKRFQPGLLTHERLNELVDAINALQRLSVTAPLQLSQATGVPVISMAIQGLIRVIELTADLSPGGSADCKLLFYSGSVWDDVPLVETTVHDPIGTFTGVVGDRGLAVEDADSGLLVLLQLECSA